MSVKELKIVNGDKILNIKADRDKLKLMMFGKYAIGIELDRNQAHLLMLYLQEHLK